MALELHGIIPPMVTPFDPDDNVDEGAVRAEARHLLGAGVHGLCVTGSTGEGATLSPEESATVAGAVVQEAGGSVPVIAGVIRNSTRDAVRYGRALRDARVDALQVTPVHYLFRPDEEATLTYYRQIVEEVGLPVVIYNVAPWAILPPSTVLRIFDEVAGVIALKQSGGDMHSLAEVLHAAPPGKSILTAVDDLLYPSFILGARGAVAATLTVVPELGVQLWDAVQAGDHAAALSLHNKLLPVWGAVAGPNMPARIKAGLAVQGRQGGRTRSPMSQVSATERVTIRSALDQAGVALDSRCLDHSPRP